MLHPGPSSSRLLACTALSATCGAWALQAGQTSGASPLTLALVGGAVLAGALPGAALPLRGAAGVFVAGIFGAAGVAGAERAAQMAATLAPDGRAVTGALVVLALLSTAPLVGVAQRALARAPSRTGPEIVGVVAGLALAMVTPPIATVALAALLLLPTITAARPVAPLPADSAPLGRLAAVAVATWATAWALSMVRMAGDPTAGALLLGAGAAVVTAAAIRPVAPRAPGAGLVASLAGVLLLQLVLWKAPGLLRLATAGDFPGGALLPPVILRTLPAAGVGVVAGLGLGLGWGPRRAALPTWAGPLLGALMLLLPTWSTPPAWGATLLAAGAIVWSLRRPVQAAGLGVAGLGALLIWSGGRPDPALLGPPLWRVDRTASTAVADADLRTDTLATASALGPGGAWSTRVDRDDWDEEAAGVSDDRRAAWFLEAEGLPVEPTGRAAGAERFAGHLGALLAPRRDRVLVLGDDAAHVVGGLLAHGGGAITVATPAPEAIRALADLSSTLGSRWLAPRVRLVPRHPEVLLRAAGPQDLVVEVVRAPWGDSLHGTVTRAHLDAARRALADDGLYILVLHTGWLPAGAPAAIAAEVAARFPVVQGWLPPRGADTLLLVAGDKPVPYDRLVERLDEAPSLLRGMGADAPADLASLAVVDRRGLEAWQARRQGALPSPHLLGPAARQPPVLHLAELGAHISTPESLWTLESDQDVQALQIRLEARGGFLDLLAESTTGNMEAIFRQARALQKAEEGVGTSALEPLIEPHLRDAERAVALARAEGVTSAQWDEAMRFASTARMLAPTSPRPLVVLGQIALGRGSLTQAGDLFDQALELDPRHVPALTGRARVARARGDGTTAEATFREATQLAPQDWSTWQRLGVFLMEEERFSEAEEVLRRAATRSNGQSSAPHLALAQLMLLDGRPEAALLTADAALEVEESGYAWLLRGRAQLDLDQSRRAEEDCQRAVLASPGLPDARFCIGLIQARRGELQPAAESFRATLRLQPSHPGARENLGRVEEDLRVLEERQRGGTP